MFAVGDLVTVFGPTGRMMKVEPLRLRTIAKKKIRFVELDDGTKWGLDGNPYPKPKLKKHIVADGTRFGDRHRQFIKMWSAEHENQMDDRLRRLVVWRVVKEVLPQDLDNATRNELETIISFARRCMPDHFYDEDERIYRIVFKQSKDE